MGDPVFKVVVLNKPLIISILKTRLPLQAGEDAFEGLLIIAALFPRRKRGIWLNRSAYLQVQFRLVPAEGVDIDANRNDIHPREFSAEPG